MRLSVIITTYNRPDALAAVLDGYLVQTDRYFDMIIADDGSTGETKELIDSYVKKARFPIKHVWQEDKGFRAAAARNRALASTTADYVIFSDGDCIPLPGFVAGHRRLAEKGWFLTGNRILLSEDFTNSLISKRIPIYSWGTRQWINARIRGQINRLSPILPIPLIPFFRKMMSNRWEGAMTCNLSARREDLLFVNGLDESYSGWGLEDSDLVIRLINSGLKRKTIRFVSPVLHLWHRENDRSNLEKNQRLLEHRLQFKEICANRGVRQYLQERNL